MWRSKYLRRLIGVAFLAVMVLTLVEWRLRDHAASLVEDHDAREDLTTAALALDAVSANVAVAQADDGTLSHLSLSGSIAALDPMTAEALKRIVRADVLIVWTEGGRAEPIARTIEDPQALAPTEAVGPQAVELEGVEHLATQVPILRASDDAPVGFLRVYSRPAVAPIFAEAAALLVPALAFSSLVGGIMLVHARDRKTFQGIAGQIRNLADGAREVDLSNFPPNGTIYPMLQALLDLCRRHDDAAAKNKTAMMSEMATRTELDGMLRLLDAEMGRLVADLARGDFSQRTFSRFDFPEVQSLADGIQALARTMESFLKETAFVLTAMADGDLRVEMTGGYAGEFDAVERNVNSSIRQFRALIADVQATVAEGLEGVAHIGASVQDLARRANEQVAAIQETAGAMEQISTAVRTNTEAMVEADKMAQGVALSTQAGGVAARDAIAAVERIRDSSQEISDIVRVIETIAFQTTILALNSAIEAGRAGEAGRGSSVVATEVRSLAQRSSDAAKQIKALITSSEQMVIEGVEMVQSAGSALHEIESGIQSLSTRIAQVARSQIDQANAVSQINANIADIERLAVQSATLCVNSGAETEGLSASMERVGAQMDRFQVEGAAPTSKAPRDEPAPALSGLAGWDDEGWAKAV